MKRWLGLLVSGATIILIAAEIRKFLRRRDLLLVADFTNERSAINIYPLLAVGDSPPRDQIILPPLSIVADVAVADNDEIYVADEKSTIYVFSSGSSGQAPPVRAITGSTTTLYRPRSLTLDRSNRLYVADMGGPSDVGGVTVFAAGANGNTIPIARIPSRIPEGFPGVGQNTQIFQPSGIAVDATGRIFVSDIQRDYLLIFPAGANGDVAPEAVIEAGISRPNHVAIDQEGFIYVANRGGNSITIFPPGAGTGSIPIRTITSADISQPIGVAVDSAGRTYVSNYIRRSINVFSATVSGNVAPRRVIHGPQTSLRGPQGLAVVGPRFSLIRRRITGLFG